MRLHRNNVRTLLSVIAGGVAVASAASTASAAGLAVPRVGGELGYPVTSNPSAIYYNPAALSLGEDHQLEIDGTIAFRGATYTHEFEGDEQTKKDAAEPEGAEGANNGTATLFNVIAGPSAFFAAHFDDLALGAGIYVPYGGSVKWDQNEAFAGNEEYPGAVDGVARWHSIEGQLIVANLSLGGAYKLDRLSLGLATNIMFSQVQFNQARTGIGDNNAALEERSLILVSGWDWSFTLGMTIELVTDKLWFGSSYMSQPNLGDGSVLSGTLENSFGSEPVDVDFHQSLPDVIRAGLRYEPDPAIQIRLSGDYSRWSAFKEQCVGRSGKPCAIDADGAAPANSGTIRYFNRSFKDAWGARVGFSYYPTDTLEVLGGIGYDSNAVPAETLDPALMDSDDISATVGLHVGVTDGVRLGAEYTHIQYFDRDTRGQSELAIPFDGSPGKNPDGAGQYSQWIGMLNLSLQARF